MKDKNELSSFETEILVRPDDIDMNNHVHNTKYLDYVQAARFIQMRENYKFPMEEYIERGVNWYASTAHIDFKRSLKLDDVAVVRTQIKEWNGAQVNINFWIFNKSTKKVVAEGHVIYTLISLETGKPVRIPEDVIERHKV